MSIIQFVLVRLVLAWQVLRHGLPPEMPGLRPIEILVKSPRSHHVRRAVKKVLLDLPSHPKASLKRDEALQWATTYEYGSRKPWTWEHAFLVEYWVGVEKGLL